MEIGGYSTHHRPPPFARGLPSFEDIDADTSGGISLQEYQDAAKTRRGHGRGPDPAKRFARIDGDADGSITNGELSAFRARFQPATAGALIGAQETRPAAKPETGPPSLEDRLAELFAKLDGDGDGAISLSELLAAVKNLPTGNNDPDEGAGADAAEAASRGSGTGVTDAAEDGVTAAVEEPATAIPAAASGDTAVEAPIEAGAVPIAANGGGDGETEGDGEDSRRDRWRARLEAWGDRFGDAWRDRFADRAERWHDRWADRLTDRAETRADRIGDRWDARRAAGADDTTVAGALRELIALLREALGKDVAADAPAGTEAPAGTDVAGPDAEGTDAAAIASVGDATSTVETAAAASAETGTTAAAGTPATGAPADPAALGDAAIDRLAALLATRIEAYLKAGTQNAAAETTLSATA